MDFEVVFYLVIGFGIAMISLGSICLKSLFGRFFGGNTTTINWLMVALGVIMIAIGIKVTFAMYGIYVDAMLSNITESIFN